MIASLSQDGGRRPRRPRGDACQPAITCTAASHRGVSSAITLTVKTCGIQTCHGERVPTVDRYPSGRLPGELFSIPSLPGWIPPSQPSKRGDTNECRRRRRAAGLPRKHRLSQVKGFLLHRPRSRAREALTHQCLSPERANEPGSQRRRADRDGASLW